MIVVDSNVVAYLYLPGEHTAKAEALLEREPEWAAPVLWRSEFRTVLAGYLRRGTLTFDQACSIQREAEDLLAGSEFEVDAEAVLDLVRARRAPSRSLPHAEDGGRPCSHQPADDAPST